MQPPDGAADDEPVPDVLEVPLEAPDVPVDQLFLLYAPRAPQQIRVDGPQLLVLLLLEPLDVHVQRHQAQGPCGRVELVECGGPQPCQRFVFLGFEIEALCCCCGFAGFKVTLNLLLHEQG